MKILYTGAFTPNKETLEIFDKHFDEVYFLQFEDSLISEDYLDANYIICNNLFKYHEISKFNKLQFVQFTSAGLDRVPIQKLLNFDVKFNSARGVYSIPISEWVVLSLLQTIKQSYEFFSNQKNRDLFELNGKTALIIGYGDVGKEIAKRLFGFNVNINVYHTKKVHDDLITKSFTSPFLENAILSSEIIILTLPLTKQTYHLIDSKIINNFLGNKILVNVSRGAIIDQRELEKYMDKNNDLKLCLDVFEKEPLEKESKLWANRNCIISPHNSYASVENNKRLNDLVVKNIYKILKEQ